MGEGLDLRGFWMGDWKGKIWRKNKEEMIIIGNGGILWKYGLSLFLLKKKLYNCFNEITIEF